MKHIFKSLLVTSVLTVPNTFATGDANLTEDTPATQADNTQEVSLTGPLKVLSNEHLSSIIGLDPSCCPGRDRIHLGYFDLKDLARLACTSRKFNYFAQPIISRAENWRPGVVTILFSPRIPQSDQNILALFGYSSPLTSFEEYLRVLSDLRFYTISISLAQIQQNITIINQHPTLLLAQKSILMKLLPNATLNNIYRAAHGLNHLGLHDKIAPLYKKAATHPDATPTDIYRAADELKNLGPDYHDRAAELYEQSANYQKATPTNIFMAIYANHPKATPTDIYLAAVGLKDLGPTYCARAARLKLKYKQNKHSFFLTN